MLVSQFNFTLPAELIATTPAKPRDSARLLVVDDHLKDLLVSDIPSFLRSGDIIVFNDTKVIPAQLYGKKNGAAIAVTLHKHVAGKVWRSFAKPARKLAVGDIFKVSDEFYAKVLSRDEAEVVLEFNLEGDEFFSRLDRHGMPPLPPYISRQVKKPVTSDFDDYQTIYAKNKGAVAAPTAGLHFTRKLLDEIIAGGVGVEFLTLHVGAGTFLPMKVADTRDHKMHSEYGVITPEAAKRINLARQQGGRVIAVGTTSLRLLESATKEDGVLQPFMGETDIFITPGYKFKAVDMLITNFHLPESTLFMLVAAFSGLEKMKQAYNHAISNKYRFYSYGDACLLKRTFRLPPVV